MVEAGISSSYTYSELADLSINELIDRGVRFTIVADEGEEYEFEGNSEAEA